MTERTCDYATDIPAPRCVLAAELEAAELKMMQLSEAYQKLMSALSLIDYLCGEPNEYEVSGYDVHKNEDAVVEHVRRRLGK